MDPPALTVSPASQSPLLVSDVVYNVVMCLEADKTALAVCAVICRQWLPLSRNLLFRRIRVETTPKAWGFESFVEFLSRSPSIAAHIRSLTLRGHNPMFHIPTKGNSEREWGKKYCQWINPIVLTAILDKLPNLQSLALTQLTWDHRPRTSPNAFDNDPHFDPPPPRSLQKLELVSFGDSGPTFKDQGRNDILCYFAQLDELHLWISSHSVHMVQQICVSPVLRVRSLVISGWMPGGVYNALPKQPFRGCLRSLQIPWRHVFGETSVILWLKETAIDITHFSLDFNLHDYMDAPSVENEIPFWDLLSDLRSIEVQIGGFSVMSPYLATWTRILQSLECAPLPRLERLRFTFNTYEGAEHYQELDLLSSLPLEELDRMRCRWSLRENIQVLLPGVMVLPSQEHQADGLSVLLSCTFIDVILGPSP